MDKKAQNLLESQMFSLQDIPVELKQKFTLMRELDDTRHKLQNDVDITIQRLNSQKSNEQKGLKAQQLKKQLESDINQILRQSTEKVNIAQQVYDIVDGKIRILDEEFSNLKAELLKKNQDIASHKNSTEQQLLKLKQQQQQLQQQTGPTANQKKRRREQQQAEQDRKNLERGSKRARRVDKEGGGRRGGRQEDNARGRRKRNTNQSERKSRKQGSNKRGEGRERSSQEPDGDSYFPGLKLSTGPPEKATDAIEQDPENKINEPTYCYCNQVSYGEMIACENQDCAIEWFHYPCVDIDKAHLPTTWYCNECQKKMNDQN